MVRYNHLHKFFDISVFFRPHLRMGLVFHLHDVRMELFCTVGNPDESRMVRQKQYLNNNIEILWLYYYKFFDQVIYPYEPNGSKLRQENLYKVLWEYIKI